jgi:hypothetical protein
MGGMARYDEGFRYFEEMAFKKKVTLPKKWYERWLSL